MGNICCAPTPTTIQFKPVLEGSGSSEQLGRNYEVSFRKKDLLGRGGDGNVFKVKDRLNKESYALKAIKKIDMEKEDPHFIRLKKEISTLRTLDHFNITKYYSTYEDNDKFYILMEYAAGGSLTKHV